MAIRVLNTASDWTRSVHQVLRPSGTTRRLDWSTFSTAPPSTDPFLNCCFAFEIVYFFVRKTRQWSSLELIASENFTSRAVMDCLGSALTNKVWLALLASYQQSLISLENAAPAVRYCPLEILKCAFTRSDRRHRHTRARSSRRTVYVVPDSGTASIFFALKTRPFLGVCALQHVPRGTPLV